MRQAPSTIRLAEIFGALSHALDLTEGQPEGHCVRCTFIGVRIGTALGLQEAELHDLYYTLLLKDLGCSSNAARICELYLTDDIDFKRASKQLDDSLSQVLRFVFSQTGLKAGLAERFRALVNIARNGEAIVDELMQTRCQRGADIAKRLRFSNRVADGIRSLDEHWSGSGRPDRLRGEAIPLAARIALLAQIADVFHRGDGIAAAISEVRQRAHSWFDPALVAIFEKLADDPDFWATLARPDIDAIVLALEPGRTAETVSDAYLDDIAEAFADVVDSKSPFTNGHSKRVALFTDLIAERLGLDAEHRRWLKRAALLHDIGKLGVSNAILDKPGRPDAQEWDEIRLHPTNSEAILSQVGPFAELARIGGAHHERLDGKGYPRGLSGAEISFETRIVTVADIFDALTADRPYRAAMPVSKALGIMRADVGTAIDADCFAALEAAVAILTVPGDDALNAAA